MKNTIRAVLFMGACWAAFFPLAMRAADTDAAAKGLAKLDREWSAASEKRDVDLLVSYYADDAIAYPPDAPALTDRAAIHKAWAGLFGEPTFKLAWKTLHAEISKSGDLGFTSGSFEDSFKGPDGKLVTEKGKYLCVWKKEKDGTWKAIHDMWNSDAK